MIRKVLKNKPLAEAIFELRWELQEPAQGMKVDPHYKILIGVMYDKVEDEWPLIKIGPGIITLNDTGGVCMGRF